MNFEVRRINIDVIVKPSRSINPFTSLSTKKRGYITSSFQPVTASYHKQFQLTGQRLG